MKFVCPYFDDVICIKDGYFNSIVIENQLAFRKITEDISSQIEGFEGESVLSINNTPCPFSKRCEIIKDFAPFNIGKKSIMNGILSALDKTAVNEQFYAKTQELLSQIENYVYELAFDNLFDIECNKVTPASLLKAMGITLKDDYENTLEKIVDYMELVNGFECDKLYVTVNMRSYFTDEEMELFVKTVLDHGIKILMFENMEYPNLTSEKRLIIDKDFCVFS